MKKMFSLVLALVMALSLTTVAWGATTSVADFDELRDAVDNAASGDTIKLTADIALPASDSVNGINGLITVDNKVLTFDLGGKTLSRAASSIFYIINGGSLTVTNGTLACTANNAAVYSGGNGITANKIVLDSVTVNASQSFGVYHNGSKFGADVTIKNSTIVSTAATGVFLSGSSTWAADQLNKLAITNSTVKGVTAVEVKYADVVVDNSTLTATATTAAMGYNNNGSNTNGYALVLTHSGADGVEESATGSITVNSGSFVGAVGIQETGDEAVGTVAAETANTADAAVVVSGGTFTDDVSEYVVAGKVFVNGEVQNSTPAGNTTTYDVKDLTVTNPAGVKQDTTGITSVIKVASVTNTTTVNGKTTTTVVPAYYQLADGSFASTFVECDKSVADYMFTIKGVGSVYVRAMAVPAAFDATPVTLYTAPKTATCGMVGANEDVYVVANGKYYPTKNVVAESYGLLNGKMVVFDKTTAATPTPHDWDDVTAATYDAKTGKLTSVKCPECKGVISVYTKPGSFDGKEYKMVGGTGIAAAYYYVVGAVATQAPAAGTTSSTVQSAQTFDAGIAMYFGMSVMAAAGSAVVIGKKKD